MILKTISEFIQKKINNTRLLITKLTDIHVYTSIS